MTVSRPGEARPVTPLSILAAKVARVSERLDRLDDLDPRVAAEARCAARLAEGMDGYTTAMSTPESPALRALADRTAAEDWTTRSGGVPGLEQEMLSGHIEGLTLRFLVAATRARRVLEIGMFTGYSALAMAEALPDDGELVACELDAGVAALAQECFAASSAGRRISVRVGPAQQTLATLADQAHAFDLVFLDADKAGYAGYFRTLLDRDLLAPGGLLCVDNTLMQGEPWLATEPSANGAAIAAFNRVVADDPRVEQVLLPVRDGLTLVRRVDR